MREELIARKIGEIEREIREKMAKVGEVGVVLR